MASCSSRALLAPAAREARDSPRRALAVTVLNTRSLLLSAVLAAASLSSASAWSPTAHGALVAVAPPSGAAYNVELAVEGLASFRVSVVNDSSVLPAQIATPMVVDKTAYAIYTVSQAGTVVNLTAPGVGSVSLDAASGAFALADASGRVLTSAPTLLSASASPPDVRRDTCANPQVDSDAANPQRSKNYPNGATVTDQTVCCERCNNDPACTAWVYDTQADSPNCWPLSDAGGRSPNVPNRVLGAPPPPPALAFNFTTSPAATFVGAGTDGPSAKTLIRTGTVQAGVANTASWTPSFHCSDGWSLLAASPRVDAGDGVHGTGVYGVSWTRGPPAVGGVTVHVTGASADLYLTPAADLRAHVTTQAALEGTAAVLPRYSYAFYACRWGWVNQTYIEGVLARFRALQAPLDTMISDFEWYTPKPDYSLPPEGNATFEDFSYNPITWPAPASALIARYRAQYNVRFAGIRKPRLGNSALLVMAQENGWLMGQGGSPAGTPDGSRNLNYSRADVREWYSYQNEGYLQDGVVGWWNDEAEDDYFTFTWWTLSERATFANSDIPNRRFVSINRAFAPGAARLGAVTWTGDISPQWEDLQRTPGYMLNWGLAGQPLVTCDTGGFAGESNALLLARWYGLSAFSPVMRVHSTIGSTPHFPFPELWGAEAATAMVAALNLRYRLLPHTYALAHEANRVGLPIMRPMAMEFPADPSLADVTAQFMYGGMILVAPVLTPDNATSAYLPADTWFEWDSARTHVGPTTLSLPAVPLGVTPAFVRSGAILSLAPAGLQYSDALPGGPLSIVVYGGKDGAHVMYDDDGETTDYETGAVATITFTWKDSTGCLSWVRAGTFAGGPRSFVQLTVTAYTTSGATKTAPATAIGVGGSVCPA